MNHNMEGSAIFGSERGWIMTTEGVSQVTVITQK